MSINFNCPHCNKLISVRVEGADPGVDALGFPVNQEVVPKPITPPDLTTDKSLWRRAFITPSNRDFTVIMANGEEIKFKGGRILPAYYEGDGSLSDMFKKQFPRVQCGEIEV